MSPHRRLTSYFGWCVSLCGIRYGLISSSFSLVYVHFTTYFPLLDHNQIHPVLDRLLTAKRLSTPENKIAFGSNWGSVETFTELDWTDYSYYDNYPYEGYHCSGHGKEVTKSKTCMVCRTSPYAQKNCMRIFVQCCNQAIEGTLTHSNTLFAFQDLVLSGIPMLEWVERQVPGGNGTS